MPGGCKRTPTPDLEGEEGGGGRGYECSGGGSGGLPMNGWSRGAYCPHESRRLVTKINLVRISNTTLTEDEMADDWA